MLSDADRFASVERYNEEVDEFTNFEGSMDVTS